jgi:small basic protein
MWLALLAFGAALAYGLHAGWTVTTAAGAEVSLLVLVLVEAGLRALRRNLAGVYTDRGFSYYLLTMGVVVLGLAWLGEQLSLGRVGQVSSLTLALEIALAFRMLSHVDAIREALVQPGGEAASETGNGPGWPGDGKEGRLA